MNSFTSIDHVGIRVNGNDYSKSREFYEKLGFEWIAGPVGPEPVAIMTHKSSGVTLNLILNANSTGNPDENVDDSDLDKPYNVLMDNKAGKKYAGITHIALHVPDLDAVENDLNDAGITIQEKMSLPNGARMLFIRDPDRTTIEFHQPAPPKSSSSGTK